MKRLRIAAAAVAGMVIVASPLAARQASGDGAAPAFYTWTKPLPGKPGVLLDAENLPPALMLSSAGGGQRLLYTSTDGVKDSGIVAVSGALFLPKGPRPEGGWPLVAWAHGTVGVADACAPSVAGRSDRDIRYLNAWLDNGFAVVATDYQGLGTAGHHPYIEARPGAYSVLDSVRAVRAAHPGAFGGVVVVGQSQGGGAAFATAAFAFSYAPDVPLKATVATGTPNLSIKNLAAASNSDQDRVDPTIAYAFYLAATAEAEQPGVDVSQVFTDQALPVYRQATKLCVEPLFEAVIKAGLSRANALKPEGQAAVFGPMLPKLVYPTLKLSSPIFMGVGADDKDVNPVQQLELAKAACAAGSTVEAHLYKGLDHSGVVNASLKDSLPFVRKALAGKPVASRCDPIAE